ncbi:sterol carrier family protein [Brevibacterium album]|uniref:sterol carrier family protein n=1 Tax=Brevibacterium album TaxID=417948 RepID=UPI000425DD15|nr:sterol carrier family protein [Brevibacterium album]
MSRKRRTDPAAGIHALQVWCTAVQNAGAPVDRRTLATAVRFTLEELAVRHEGGSVEVRVPPFGVTQAVAGPAHTRGTPPNTVETSPEVWLGIVTGRLDYAEAVAGNRIEASGTRSDLSGLVPLFTAEGHPLS